MARWNGDTRPAWTGSTRKSRLPADWPRLRQVVLKRCNHTCEWVEDGRHCVAIATDVDHIRPGDDHSLLNLQGLCNHHHLVKTGRDVQAAQAKRRALGKLPEEPQPGVIKGPPKPTERRGF
jgi:5-methylcytosine-specific restriction endonuclease McrA